MPSYLSDTEICNLALDYLDEAPLTNISDNSAVGRWFQRNFWPVARSLIRKHPWNFAIARAELPASALAPIFGYDYAYQLPPDCLRVLPLTDNGTPAGRPASHKVEGTSLLTNMSAPLRIRYLKNIDNTGLFDQQFCDCLAIALAQKAAHFITGKQSYAQALQQAAAQALVDARLFDSLEGTPEDPIADEWLLARM